MRNLWNYVWDHSLQIGMGCAFAVFLGLLALQLLPTRRVIAKNVITATSSQVFEAWEGVMPENLVAAYRKATEPILTYKAFPKEEDYLAGVMGWLDATEAFATKEKLRAEEDLRGMEAARISGVELEKAKQRIYTHTRVLDACAMGQARMVKLIHQAQPVLPS